MHPPLHILPHCVFLICLELWATLLNTAAMLSSVTFGLYLYSVGICAEMWMYYKQRQNIPSMYICQRV